MPNPNEETHIASNVDSSERFVLLSLIVSSSVVWIPSLLAGILLVDIGETFGHPVGVVGQMFTVSRIVGVGSALILGVLSVRFKHKTLLMLGLLSFVACSLGCSLAPDLNVMLISYSLSGLGMAVVMPMSMTLVGEHFPLERRASVIGYISVSTAIAGIIGGPIIGLIVGYGGWRLAFIVFVLPLSLLGLIAASRWLPSRSYSRASEMSDRGIFGGFRKIFSSRSAAACLIGYALTLASFTAIGAYGPSFLRERFLASTDFVSMLMAGMNLVYSLFSAVSGRLVDKFGRKPMLVSSLIFSSLLIVSYANMGNLWLSAFVILMAYSMAGMVFPVSNSLTLEQVPSFRGTMMSLNAAAENLGMAIGSGVGGMLLLRYDYGSVGMSLGILGLVATLLYQTVVVDPIKTSE